MERGKNDYAQLRIKERGNKVYWNVRGKNGEKVCTAGEQHATMQKAQEGISASLLGIFRHVWEHRADPEFADAVLEIRNTVLSIDGSKTEGDDKLSTTFSDPESYGKDPLTALGNPALGNPALGNPPFSEGGKDLEDKLADEGKDSFENVADDKVKKGQTFHDDNGDN